MNNVHPLFSQTLDAISGDLVHRAHAVPAKPTRLPNWRACPSCNGQGDREVTRNYGREDEYTYTECCPTCYGDGRLEDE